MESIFKVPIWGAILAASMMFVQELRAGPAPPQSTEVVDIFVPGSAIATSELAAQAGGADTSITMGDLYNLTSNTNQSAHADSNIISGTINSGSNYVSDAAFQNTSGIATLIQNTGSQVVIQNSMNLNLLMR